MNNTLLWVFQILLAGWFLVPGLVKLFMPVTKLVKNRQLEEGRSPLPIRILGFLELMGVIGITVPQRTGILPVLTPITAVFFAIVMAGAFRLHNRKREYKPLPLISIAFVLALLVGWFRFRGSCC